jgi:hypothetical protein
VGDVGFLQTVFGQKLPEESRDRVIVHNVLLFSQTVRWGNLDNYIIA